jgi:UDP-N-acetylmuramyl pentapeptide synthase
LRNHHHHHRYTNIKGHSFLLAFVIGVNSPSSVNQCLMNIEQLYKIYLQYPSVETDTRKIKGGDIFFALKGPSFNGNSFAQKALEAGAAYAVVDEAATKKPSWYRMH